MSEKDQSDNSDLAQAIIECLQRGDEYDDLYSFSSGRVVAFKQHEFSISIPHEGEGPPYAAFGGVSYFFTAEDWQDIAKALQHRSLMKPWLSKAELINKLKTPTNK